MKKTTTVIHNPELSFGELELQDYKTSTAYPYYENYHSLAKCYVCNRLIHTDSMLRVAVPVITDRIEYPKSNYKISTRKPICRVCRVCRTQFAFVPFPDKPNWKYLETTRHKCNICGYEYDVPQNLPYADRAVCGECRRKDYGDYSQKHIPESNILSLIDKYPWIYYADDDMLKAQTRLEVFAKDDLIIYLAIFYSIQVLETFTQETDPWRIFTLPSKYDMLTSSHWWNNFVKWMAEEKRYIIKQLLSFLEEYTFISCLTEYRYAPSYSDNKVYSKYFFVKEGFLRSRADIYPQTLKIYHEFPEERLDILKSVVEPFFKNWWIEGYGDFGWGKIGQNLVNYWEGKYSDEVFIDTAASLEHNSNTYFNKIMPQTHRLLRLLDTKATIRKDFGHLLSFMHNEYDNKILPCNHPNFSIVVEKLLAAHGFLFQNNLIKREVY